MIEPVSSSSQPVTAEATANARPGLKLLIELGPLLLFIAAYSLYGIYAATGVLMGATLVSLLLSWLLLGHVGKMPIATAALVWIFGSLTLFLDNPQFIYVKPTMVNLLFAGILAVGLFRGRTVLKSLLGEALHLTDAGWRLLTIRWIGFFVAMAMLNEFVWRTMSEPTWVKFKVGILPLTIVFAAAQIGLIRRHGIDEPTK